MDAIITTESGYNQMATNNKGLTIGDCERVIIHALQGNIVVWLDEDGIMQVKITGDIDISQNKKLTKQRKSKYQDSQ